MGLTSLRPDSTTKSERKFEKKLQFYAKVRDNVVNKVISKKKKHRRKSQKKGNAYDLSALSEFLPDPELKTPLFKLNSKTRQKLVMKEGKQLKTVLNHPAFQSNPLASIHQHLLSTQPPIENEKPAKKSSKTVKKKKSKKKKSKASSVPQSMEEI